VNLLILTVILILVISAKKCTCVLLPTITVCTVINLSLASGVFPDEFKSSSLQPLLKKSNSDKNELSKYRSLVLISFLSKLAERVVEFRLTDILTEHNLLNSFLSAYTKLHSTETVLLALFMIISSEPVASDKFVTSVFLIFPLHLIPSIILFFLNASHLGLVTQVLL
jgi:hypothetical protein